MRFFSPEAALTVVTGKIPGMEKMDINCTLIRIFIIMSHFPMIPA